jgi:CBS domain-containing protein
MTMTDQLFDVLGLNDNATRRTTRRMMRAGRNARRASEEYLGNVPNPYLWLGIGVAAVAMTFAFRDRLPLFGGRKVRDVMVRDVVTIDSSTTLIEAAQKMRDGNVGMLPVVENGRLRGVVTDRDLVVRAMARNMDATSTPVRYVCTDDLASARPDWSIEEAMQAMSESQVGRLPVVDDDERVIGIVTLSSLALRSREQKHALSTAQEVSRRSARIA